MKVFVPVRVTGFGPITVRLEPDAPAKGDDGPYSLVKRYQVK